MTSFQKLCAWTLRRFGQFQIEPIGLDGNDHMERLLRAKGQFVTGKLSFVWRRYSTSCLMTCYADDECLFIRLNEVLFFNIYNMGYLNINSLGYLKCKVEEKAGEYFLTGTFHVTPLKKVFGYCSLFMAFFLVIYYTALIVLGINSFSWGDVLIIPTGFMILWGVSRLALDGRLLPIDRLHLRKLVREISEPRL